MNGIIDFHTHAFPDKLATSAIPYLEKEGNVKACLDGTISSLLASMDRAGIEQSVVCSIATRPAQFDSILAWSKQIRSDRIIPFLSFHPSDVNYLERIDQIKAEGFKGIKLHPYYQEFKIDEDRLLAAYEKICENNLIVVMHTGFDIAFPRLRIADPPRIMRVIERFPELKLVTTHLGSWEQWDEVRASMAGKPVYMDISYTLDFLPREEALAIINLHPREYLIFGTDSPWADQEKSIRQLRDLGLDQETTESILRKNGNRLLASV